MTDRSTHQATVDLYREAATTPQGTLCCVATPPIQWPDLRVPQIMYEMNYGCGSTVRPSDVSPSAAVLYLGVGAGLEILQFAYLTRRHGAVIGVDVVDEMIARCRENLADAARDNPWFDENFVDLRQGDATRIPLEDETVDVVAQNCLFNIFEAPRLESALTESYRVLRPGGRLVISDPICEAPLPSAVRDNPELRAQCLSGALPLDSYVQQLVAAGFGTLEVRSRRPYRSLNPRDHGVDEVLLLETVEVVAIKTPMPADGPCVFTGRTATYVGPRQIFDDGHGHQLRRNLPLEVCDKTAAALAVEAGDEMIFTPSTWHYGGGGCC